MIHYVKGDLLAQNYSVLCHQVNCYGVMGAGIARQIAEKWPHVCKQYRNMVFDEKRGGALLGNIQIVEINPHQSICNMFAQNEYGSCGRYTSYDAFWNCLHLLKHSLSAGLTIGFPKGIGCGLGGANWAVIETMIKEVLAKDFEVYIVEL